MAIIQWSDKILIVELADEPQFSEDVNALVRRLDEGPAVDVVLNMSAVTYLNSSNIAQILKLRTKISNASGRMKICSVDNAVWSVLLITGLDKIFDFTEDVSTSLASLQMGL